MDSRLVVKYRKEVDQGGIFVTTCEAVGLQLFQGDGFFPGRNCCCDNHTHTPELNQSKQCDTYNHAMYTVEMVYLERPGKGYWNSFHLGIEILIQDAP